MWEDPGCQIHGQQDDAACMTDIELPCDAPAMLRMHGIKACAQDACADVVKSAPCKPRGVRARGNQCALVSRSERSSSTKNTACCTRPHIHCTVHSSDQPVHACKCRGRAHTSSAQSHTSHSHRRLGLGVQVEEGCHLFVGGCKSLAPRTPAFALTLISLSSRQAVPQGGL